MVDSYSALDRCQFEVNLTSNIANFDVSKKINIYNATGEILSSAEVKE